MKTLNTGSGVYTDFIPRMLNTHKVTVYEYDSFLCRHRANLKICTLELLPEMLNAIRNLTL